MRGTQATTPRRAIPPSTLPHDHPLIAITSAFSALDGIDDEHPELAAEVRTALAALQDLAWIARSRIFDGRDRSDVRRALERVSIAVSIVSARRADASAAGPRRLRHAIGMLATTVEYGTATITRAGIETPEIRGAVPAPRPQHMAAELIAAADGPLDRAA